MLVIRAWREGGSLRIRVLIEGEPRRHWIVASPDRAAELVRALLARLEPGGGPDGPPRDGEPDGDQPG